MPKVNHLQTNFTAGELSPRLHGRTDIAKYANGAATLENLTILPHGGITKRSGTGFVARQSDGSAKGRLFPFQFNTEQSYMLLFENNLIRVMADGGLVTDTAENITGITQANPAVVTITGHSFTNGDKIILQSVGGMVELNNREFTVANTTSNTLELSGEDSTSHTAYTSGGTAAKIIEVTTTYTTAQLQDLRFAQSADTLYIAHPAHKLAKLTRTSNTAWTLTDIEPDDGPFRTINGDDTQKMYIAIDSSTVSVSGATKADPCVITTSSAHGFESGECVTFSSVGGMTQLNGNRYFIIKLSSTTFSLRDESYRDIDSSAYGTYTSGGTVNRSITKWGTYAEGSTGHTLSTDFSYFDSDMVGQLIRLWEPGQSTGMPTAVSGAGITSSAVFTYDGKIYGLNDANTTTWEPEWTFPTHESGVVRMTDNQATEEYADAVFLHDVSAIVKITAVTDTTTATVQVVHNHIPADVITYGTSYWEEGAWSDYHGYPSVIAFHEQRLWAGGSASDPQTIWASYTNAFESFLDGDNDDNGLNFQIASEKVDLMIWMSAGKTLAVGTVGSEYSITANESGQGITPSNVRVTKQTSYGSTGYEPVRVGPVVIFPARFGDPTNAARKLREFAYSFENDAFQAQDLTIISEHVTGTGVTEMAYAEEPNSIIWCVREDGQLIGCTYEREQDVVGFHRHILGGVGTSGGGDPVVESLAVIPGDYGDELWMTVKRYINSATVRYVERITRELQEGDGKEDAVFLDSAVTYDGSAATTITGLNHLIGETVSVIGDGVKQSDKTVSSSGTISIDSASLVHVGYKITSIGESLDLEAGAQMGTSQGRVQQASEAAMRLYRSLGGQIGTNSSDLTDITYRTSVDGAAQVTPSLYTGFLIEGIQGAHERSTQVYIKHDDPYPFTLLSLITTVRTSG